MWQSNARLMDFGGDYKGSISALTRALSAATVVRDDKVPCQIEEGLFLGSLGAANNKQLLKSLNITHILTVARMISPAYPLDFEYKIIDVPDQEDTDLAKHFDECFDFIDEAKRAGGGVLVHCFVGKSQSVTIVVAYLMKRGMTLNEALEHVRCKRPQASPNPGFMRQLKNFGESLRGKGLMAHPSQQKLLQPGPFMASLSLLSETTSDTATPSAAFSSNIVIPVTPTPREMTSRDFTPISKKITPQDYEISKPIGPTPPSQAPEYSAHYYVKDSEKLLISPYSKALSKEKATHSCQCQFPLGIHWISRHPHKTREYYELILIDSGSCEISHKYSQTEPIIIEYSKCKIKHILTPEEWKGELLESRSFSAPFTPRTYHYQDYIDAWYNTFYMRPCNHSWIIHFCKNGKWNLPLWMFDWWSKIGATSKIYPSDIQTIFQQYKSETKFPYDFLCEIYFHLHESIPWIFSWDYDFPSPQENMPTPIHRYFKVKWWSEFKIGHTTTITHESSPSGPKSDDSTRSSSTNLSTTKVRSNSKSKDAASSSQQELDAREKQILKKYSQIGKEKEHMKDDAASSVFQHDPSPRDSNGEDDDKMLVLCKEKSASIIQQQQQQQQQPQLYSTMALKQDSPLTQKQDSPLLQKKYSKPAIRERRQKQVLLQELASSEQA